MDTFIPPQRESIRSTIIYFDGLRKYAGRPKPKDTSCHVVFLEGKTSTELRMAIFVSFH